MDAPITTEDVHSAARRCLEACDPDDKVRLAAVLSDGLANGRLAFSPDSGADAEPLRLGRPARPELVAPRALSQRGFGSEPGRAAFLHAIAHIEFNAINLACDAVWRFRDMPAEFYADWVSVAADEARHFTLLRRRMQDLGHDYGDFPAHNGLWEMAEKTAHSCLARMALVPRVLEARGLDVTPAMILKLRHVGDAASAEILEVILREEVAHVAAGSRWFRWCCEREGCDSHRTFAALLRQHALGAVQKPFNLGARSAAGFDAVEMDLLHDLAGAA